MGLSGPLHLPPPIVRRIREVGTAAWPHEACGLLEGTADGTAIRVARLVVCANIHDDPARYFTIDPETFLYAERDASRRGRAIVGVWHSHPHGDPAPSATDRQQAWPAWSYLIAGVSDARLIALRCWNMNESEFHEQPIVAWAPSWSPAGLKG